MKIIILSAANNPHTLRIVNNLSKRENEVILVSLKNHRYDKKYGELDERVKISYLPFSGKKGYYLNIFYLNKIIKEINPDILNVHYASGYGTLGRYAKFQNKILNIWGSDIYIYPKKNLINKMIIENNLKNYKQLVTTSYCLSNEVKKYTSKKIHIIPFGIDTQKFNVINKEKKMNFVKIGITKNLKEIYGISYLIEAISKLVEKYNKEKIIKLYIYGEGEEEVKLKTLTKNLKIEENIEFKGYISNDKIALELNNMDIMCFPSLSESFGVSAIESMSCGIPTITSDAPGFIEIIENEKDGLIIEGKSSLKIYEAIDRLIQNEKLYKLISKNCRDKIIKEYSLDVSINKFIELYEKTLEKY